MFRYMFATTAVAALLTAPVMAEDTAKQDMSQETQASSAATTTTASGSMNADISQEDVLASNFIGKTIYTSTNDDAEAIGDVEDIVLSPDGKIDAVVVSVGGFLGIGDKDVALPFDRLTMEQKNGEDWIVADASSEELNEMQEFDAAMIEPEQPVGQDGQQTAMDANAPADQQAMNENADADRDPVENAATDAAQEVEQAGENMQQAASDVVDDDDERKVEAATAEEDGQNMAAAPAAGDQADTAMDADNQQDADAAATPGLVVSGEQTASTRPSIREGMEPAERGSLSAEQLIGTAVYGADEESIGEIGDVILNEDKKIEAYVVDVGGFLGIGEKPVAISPESVELMRQPDSQDYAVFTQYTEDQLEQQNDYSEEEYENNRDSVLMQ